MKEIKWFRLLAVAAYVFFAALLIVYNVNGIKTVVITAGVTLALSAAAVFVCSYKNSSVTVICGFLVALGGIVALFSRFFVSLSLFLCGAALLAWGATCFLSRRSACHLMDAAIGALLVLDVFVLKKFLLLVVSVLMIVNAAARLLSLLGFTEL